MLLHLGSFIYVLWIIIISNILRACVRIYVCVCACLCVYMYVYIHDVRTYAYYNNLKTIFIIFELPLASSIYIIA